MCWSYSQRRIVTNDSLQAETTAPAPLNLTHGKLFFGYKYVPYERSKEEVSGRLPTFSGSGSTLSGRPNGPAPTTSASKGKGKEKEGTTPSSGNTWGGGQTLGGSSGGGGNRNQNPRREAASGPAGAGGARISAPSSQRAPPEEDVTVISDAESDEEYDPDVIYVDSD